MFEQLTTHKLCGPTAAHEQLPGHGLHSRPSAATPESAARQQSAHSRLEKNPAFGRQTPCFRLNTVCPFPQGIAHSHLIAPSVGEVFLGTRGRKVHSFSSFSIRETTQKAEKLVNRVLPPGSMTSPRSIPPLTELDSLLLQRRKKTL